MKAFAFLSVLLVSINLLAQKHVPLPHGMVFGDKPDTTDMLAASKIEAHMDKAVRVSTTLRGKVLKVTQQKGGWFELDAGNGRVIAAHFKDYRVTIPTDLQGRVVIIQGIAEKQFIADDLQHFAGDTVVGKKQHTVNVDPKRRLTFEVKGLVVDK